MGRDPPSRYPELAVFREAQKTSLKISDGRLRFRLTRDGRLRSVSQALAGFSPKFSVVHQQTRVYEAVLSAPGAVLKQPRMNALADTLWATPDFIYKKSLKGETNDPLLDSQWHHAWIGSRAAWDISKVAPRLSSQSSTPAWTWNTRALKETHRTLRST